MTTHMEKLTWSGRDWAIYLLGAIDGALVELPEGVPTLALARIAGEVAHAVGVNKDVIYSPTIRRRMEELESDDDEIGGVPV